MRALVSHYHPQRRLWLQSKQARLLVQVLLPVQRVQVVPEQALVPEQVLAPELVQPPEQALGQPLVPLPLQQRRPQQPLVRLRELPLRQLLSSVW